MNKQNTFSVIILICTLLVVMSCATPKKQPNTINLCIGTYAEGIYMVRFDTISGELSDLFLASKILNPSYINFSSSGQWLLSISEHTGKGGDAYCFKINSDGKMTLNDSLEYAGEGACHISETTPDRWVISNYNSGMIIFTAIDSLGRFDKKIQMVQHSGNGSAAYRQESSHTHSAMMDPTTQNVYVADLGTDQLVVYHTQNDKMVCIGKIATATGAGPRHFDFHPKSKMLALLNELNQTIDIMLPDSNGIYSQRQQTIKIIPDSLNQGSTSADIHFSPDGKFLYASNRGYNCLVVFAVNQPVNQISHIGTITEKINCPRNFVISHDGQFLLVANQDGNNVVVFKRNQQNGLLTLSGCELAVKSPVCLKFAE